MRRFMFVWGLASYAWELNEESRKISEAMLAILTMESVKRGLKLPKADPRRLSQAVMSVIPVIEDIASKALEAGGIGCVVDPRLSSIMQDLGLTHTREVAERLLKAVETLREIVKGELRDEEVRELKRILENIIKINLAEIARLLREMNILAR